MLKTDLNLTARFKLYYDLFVPENFTSTAPLLIAVHGYGAHKRHMMREAQTVAPENFVIASIQAPHQHFRQTENGYKTGFGWLTDFEPEESVLLHHNFVLELIEKLAGNRIVDTKKIYIYGFSQASALNFRFALTFPEILRGVIAVCGGIPSDLETNASYNLTNSNALYLYSDEDEFYPLEKYEKFVEKLKNFAPNIQAKRFAAKHEITDEMREEIKNWLMADNN